jgi:hypothetical protein
VAQGLGLSPHALDASTRDQIDARMDLLVLQGRLDPDLAVRVMSR